MNIRDYKDTFQSILIIRRNNIGDMICSIPVFKTLRREFPRAYIAVLADSINAGIIEGASFIDKVIVYKKGSGIYENKYIGYWNLFRQHKQKFDIAIGLKIGFSSTLALITLISRARIRVGCIPEKWHMLQYCYNSPVRGYKKWESIHHIDAVFEFIKTIGIEDPVKDISIEITPGSRKKITDFFTQNRLTGVRNIVIYNISNNKPENTWSIERFKETADVLSKQYQIIYIITSAPIDKDNALKLSKEINNALYFETHKVMDFAALVSESALLICGEGGAMHIGAGVHTPTISLWREIQPLSWAPYGERQFVVKKGDHVDAISADDLLEVIKKNNLLQV